MQSKFLFSTLILSTLLACSLSSCGNKEQEIKTVKVSDSDYIHSLGRTSITTKDQQEMLYFANSCSGFAFQVEMKKEAQLTFSLFGSTTSPYEAQYAKVYVDEEPVEVLKIERGIFDYTLTQAISTGEHEIRLLKMNEPAFSSMGLLKICEGDFVFKKYVSSKTKRIEFYGDSITCGYGNLADNSQSFKMETEDGTQAYTQLCADQLGFENSVVSYSGIAMALSPFQNTFTMLDRYATLDGSQSWNFNQYVPDVIVINLGTNDNTKLRTLTGNDQIEGLNAFYENLKQMSLDLSNHAPHAKFVFVYNMMLTISDGLVTCMESVARELNKKQENTAYILECQPNYLGADGHPSLEGHQQSAKLLKDLIDTIIEQ